MEFQNVRELCSNEESFDWTMYLEFKTPSPIAQPIDQTLSLWSSEMEDFGFIANHVIFSNLPNHDNVESEAVIGGGNDNVNCGDRVGGGDDAIDMYKLPAPFMGLTPLENSDRLLRIKTRLTQALRYIKELAIARQLLVQVWAPVWSGNHYVLTTSGQPFILCPYSNTLTQYRAVSLMYMFAVDGETDEFLGLPGRVFKQKLPEWTPDVRFYTSSEYPQVSHAIQYDVRGTLALPVFEPSSMSCVGVLELIMTTQKLVYASEIDVICKALEAVNLRSSVTLDHPNTQICNEGKKSALAEILIVLTEVCETFKLPLAQTWIPCRHQSVLAYGGGLKKSCSSCDSSGMGRVCMSTSDGAFYVLDGHMWGFQDACSEHHLQIGQGVPGRAFSSYRPFLCCDILVFCKIEYPLVHYARLFGLRGSFAICLKSKHTGDDDYVLEFFLPSSIRDSAEQLKLLDFIWTTIKQNLQNLVPASGNTLEEEREHIEVYMNDNQNLQIESNKACQQEQILLPAKPAVFSDGQSEMPLFPEKNINHLEVHMDDLEVVPTPATLQNEDGLRPSDGQVIEKLNSVVTRSELVCAVNFPSIWKRTMWSQSDYVRADEGTSRQDTNPFFCLKEADAAKRQRDSVAGGREVHSLPYPPIKTLRGGIEGEVVQFPDETTEEFNLDFDVHLVTDISKHALENKQMGAMMLEHEEHIPPFDQETSSYHPNESVGNENSHLALENGQNDKIQQMECLKGKEKKIAFTLEDIQSFWSKNMRQADAGKVLGVSRSTMKRRLRELGVKEWKSSRSKSQCLSSNNKHGQSPQSKPVNDCNLAPGPASECLIDETHMKSGRELIDFPFVARQDSSPSTIVIKAKYKEDTVRIDFSCNSSVDELVTEVGKRFKLELCRFKINYLDEDKECMLMTHNSDLQYALRASLSSGSKIIRLMVSDL